MMSFRNNAIIGGICGGFMSALIGFQLVAGATDAATPDATIVPALAGTPRFLLAPANLPTTAPQKALASLDTTAMFNRLHSVETSLRRGDRLVDPLRRAGVSASEHNLAIRALSRELDARRLAARTEISLVFATPERSSEASSDDQSLVRVEVRDALASKAVARRGAGDTFVSDRTDMRTVDMISHAQGRIDSSVYAAATSNGLSPELTTRLIDLFSFDVDFQREIRSGDSFELLYRQTAIEADGAMAEGDIMMARLTLSGVDKVYYRHSDPDSSEFFNAEGKSIRQLLIKTPVDGARLSSRFGRRRHPVLNYTRMHKGIDFAAGVGTPIKAAGDGVVERASYYGSFGNYVRLRHANGYQTIYAHLSKYAKGLREGQRVQQGEIIGYVGRTGRVTGPHLHYEVKRGGRHVNPLTLNLPSGRVLKGEELERFKAHMLATRQLADDVARVSNLAIAELGKGQTQASLATAPPLP